MELLRYRNQFALLILTVGVYVVGTTILKSSLVLTHPEMIYAVAFDFLIFVPLLLYFTFRSTSYVIPSIALSFALSVTLLSADATLVPNWLANTTMAIAFLAELCLVGFVGLKLYRGISSSNGAPADDPVDRIRETVSSVTGNSVFSAFVAAELTTFYFLFRLPFKEKRAEGLFHYRAKRGLVSLHIGIILLTIQETVVVHMIVGIWSPMAAWFLTLASMYFVLLVAANLRACFALPTSVSGETVRIRYGHVFDAEIPFTQIESIEALGTDQTKAKNAVKASIAPGFEQANCLLRLKNEQSVSVFMGFRKKATEIAFYVDDPSKLIENLERGS